jgi:hypothetical protein
VNTRVRPGNAFPVEEFVQALSAQLDMAQDALALKARTGRPLTFALKDLAVELKVFWEVQPDGRLLLRHAAPGETGASTVNLGFTTITRAMVEENTLAFGLEDDGRSLGELGGEEGLDDRDRRRLEMVGVRTVGQFRKVMEGADPRQMEALLGTPVDRLRLALERSSTPVVTGHEVVRRPDGRRLLRIQGANLTNGERPRVRLGGEAVEVIEARPHEVVVRPLTHHRSGEVEVLVGAMSAHGFFELPGDPTPTQEVATT